MERVFLVRLRWKKRRQQQPESPRRAPVPRPTCASRCAPVLGGPGFPEPASPFQSTRSTRQPCPPPGRPTRRPPGRAVA